MKPDPPLILAFDTSVAHVAAALLSGDTALVEKAETMAKGQAERLFPLLEEVLAEGGITWSDLTAIGVGIGPGNFTGIRISVSAARGLALSLGIPAVGVSSFEAQAIDAPRPVLSLVDARRDQVFVQELTDGAAQPPHVMAKSEIANIITATNTIGPSDTVSAVAVARITATRYTDTTQPRPSPLYVRAPDAAPPRDPAPVILP
ncbi:MAG: tRNA (adenosine(37)-N6)-threonylcarbamoyltransferase complex dimerization subunit type 1 TsaB [Marinosulfonomonas sp.]|nr:tRNA (adenosine(37)-N6)-threonylcarbamoyltransferase complex dimerization subunit type 1 TsaB [Marinosulfonomonas sp.]